MIHLADSPGSLPNDLFLEPLHTTTFLPSLLEGNDTINRIKNALVNLDCTKWNFFYALSSQQDSV